MITSATPVAAGSPPADPRDVALAKAARQLESTFVQQLFKAMRETVPADGAMVGRTQGEDIFTGLMDEHVAADTGTRWPRGLGDAIHRALRQKAGLDTPDPSQQLHPIHSPAVHDHASSARLP